MKYWWYQFDYFEFYAHENLLVFPMSFELVEQRNLPDLRHKYVRDWWNQSNYLDSFSFFDFELLAEIELMIWSPFDLHITNGQR